LKNDSSASIEIIEDNVLFTNALANQLALLDKQYFPTPWDLGSWLHLFHHDRLLVMITIEDQVMGFCLFDKSTMDSFAHLLKILIVPSFRDLGYGHKLLLGAVSHLGLKGINKFFLEVESDNDAAQRLYESIGFKRIHLKKDFYGKNRDALIMLKEIS